ncbi:unnamed protein product [Microthlaspi erraticum]|uniref:Uncharacterized protein n=1 Tax=Microthlaspi erraticum TaxID=1685480 RepID=A0A6D2KD57_9BRAS|nr:unnamed protein product [Microthlaspi erraticum]
MDQEMDEELDLDLSLAQYDPWVIKKKLTATDTLYYGKLYLPQQGMDSITAQMRQPMIQQMRTIEEPVPTQETPETARAKALREEAVKNDTLALQTSVTDQIFSRIAGATTSKEAWDALKAEYQGSPQVRLIKLQA